MTIVRYYLRSTRYISNLENVWIESIPRHRPCVPFGSFQLDGVETSLHVGRALSLMAILSRPNDGA